jgi:hypothetical protein
MQHGFCGICAETVVSISCYDVDVDVSEQDIGNLLSG